MAKNNKQARLDRSKLQLEEISREIVKSLNEITEKLLPASKTLYLVGGSLYRNLVRELYGINHQCYYDIDFLAEDVELDKLPSNWIVEKYRPRDLAEGCIGYRIKTGKSIFDLSLLKNHASSIMTNSSPSIGTYLRFVPLSIQSIAYDFDNKRLLGDIGIRSILDKKIWFNNNIVLEMNRDYWIDKINAKASELDFQVDF